MIQRTINSKNFIAFLLASSTGMALYFLCPFPSGNLFLRVIALRAPLVYRGALYSYTAMLFTTPYILYSILLSGLYIFTLRAGRRAKPSQLPPYPDPIHISGTSKLDTWTRQSLESVDIMMADDLSAELVLTAPEPFGAEVAYRFRCRTTLGVLTQLLAEARLSIVLAAPFMQPGEGLSAGPLADALAAALLRGVNVDIVSTYESLKSFDASQLRRNSRGSLRLYQPEPNVRNQRVLGSHAKFCIADHQRAYVGSANLTGPGLSEHLEMGVLLKGEIVQQIERFWFYSVEAGFFVPVD